MRALLKLSDNVLKDLSMWLLPLMLVPPLRFIQDKHPNRDSLLIRDYTALGLNAMSFLLTKYVIGSALKKTAIPRADLLSTLAGTLVQLTMASTGVVRLSRYLQARFGKASVAGIIPPVVSKPDVNQAFRNFQHIIRQPQPPVLPYPRPVVSPVMPRLF